VALGDVLNRLIGERGWRSADLASRHTSLRQITAHATRPTLDMRVRLDHEEPPQNDARDNSRSSAKTCTYRIAPTGHPAASAQ
jgi:hypothetical protein